MHVVHVNTWGFEFTDISTHYIFSYTPIHETPTHPELFFEHSHGKYLHI